MKKIHLLILISMITWLSQGHLSAQKAKAVTHKTQPWTEDLYQTWKIEDFTGIPGINVSKVDYTKFYYLKFNRNGQIVLFSNLTLLVDSFIAFEHNGNRYICLGPFTFSITKFSKKNLELKASSPYGERTSPYVTMSLKCVTNEMSKSNNENYIAGRNWEARDELNKHPYPDDYTLSGTFIMYLKSDHTCEVLQDTVYSKGNWEFDDDFKLTVQAGSKKNIFYLKSLAHQKLLVQIPGFKDSFLIFQTPATWPPDVKYEDWKFRQEMLKKQSLTKTEPDTVSVVEGNIPPQPTAIEVPKAVIFDPVIRTEESLPNVYKATISRDIFNTRNNTLPVPATIELKADKTFKVIYGKKSYKGKWRYIAPYSKSALILEYDGHEHYVPINIDYNFNNQYNTVRKITVTMVLPGSKEIMNVDFEPDSGSK